MRPRYSDIQISLRPDDKEKMNGNQRGSKEGAVRRKASQAIRQEGRRGRRQEEGPGQKVSRQKEEVVPGKVGRKHPETSHGAAKNIAVGAASHRAQIIDILERHPDGLTCYEVSLLTGRPPNQEATRMLELREMEVVEYVLDKDGKTLKRPTTPGNKGQVQRLKRKNRLVRIGGR